MPTGKKRRGDLGGYYLTDLLAHENKFQYWFPRAAAPQYKKVRAHGFLLVWGRQRKLARTSTNRPGPSNVHFKLGILKSRRKALGLFAADGRRSMAITCGAANQCLVSEGPLFRTPRMESCSMNVGRRRAPAPKLHAEHRAAARCE